MRARHERISFSFRICSARCDELDVAATTREILAATRERLQHWIGAWLDPVEHRPLAITKLHREVVAFYVVEVTSPPTIAGRVLTHLLALTLAADRVWADRLATRLGLISLRGPTFADLREARALPMLHRGRVCLLEWRDTDADTFALTHPDGTRVIAGQLEAYARWCVDDARATGRADDPLSALVFTPPQAQGRLVARLDAGDPSALAEAVLLERISPPVLRALLGSVRHHGVEEIVAHLRAVLSAVIGDPETTETLADAWRSDDELLRAVALRVEHRARGYVRRDGDRVFRRTEEEIEAMLDEADAAGGLLAETAAVLRPSRR